LLSFMRYNGTPGKDTICTASSGFDRNTDLRRVSRPFYFKHKGVEFAAGLAWYPDERRLLGSYGVADSESWIASIDAAEIRTALESRRHMALLSRRNP
jgi:hypothetical protein